MQEKLRLWSLIKIRWIYLVVLLTDLQEFGAFTAVCVELLCALIIKVSQHLQNTQIIVSM
jgi:hypothetical protein